ESDRSNPYHSSNRHALSLSSGLLYSPQNLIECPDNLRCRLALASQSARLEYLAGPHAALVAFVELSHAGGCAAMRVLVENPGLAGSVAAADERVSGFFEVAPVEVPVEARLLRDGAGEAVGHVLAKQPDEAGRIELRLNGVAPFVRQDHDGSVVAIGTQIVAGRFHHSGEKDSVIVNVLVRAAVERIVAAEHAAAGRDRACVRDDLWRGIPRAPIGEDLRPDPFEILGGHIDLPSHGELIENGHSWRGGRQAGYRHQSRRDDLGKSFR